MISSYLHWVGRPTYRKIERSEAIRSIATRWYETIEYLESVRQELDILAVRYDDLIEHTADTLRRIFDHMELEIPDYVDDIVLEDRRANWRKKNTWWRRRQMIKATQPGMQLIKKCA